MEISAQASGGLQNNALDIKLHQINVAQEKILERLDKYDFCAELLKIFSPEHVMADGNGCVDTTSAIETKVVTTRHGWQRGGNYSYTAACPTGYRLNACSGGTGDMGESGEFFSIEPEPNHNRCIMYLGGPAPYGGNNHSRASVHAFCIKSSIVPTS